MSNHPDSESESSSHVLGDEDKFDNNTDEDVEEIEENEEKTRVKRKNGCIGKKYNLTNLQFDSEQSATNTLKNEEVFGAKWTRLNTYNNVIWYKCKRCTKRLKITKTIDEKWTIHIEDSALNEDEKHVDEVDDDDDTSKKQKIPDNVRQEIFKLYRNGVRPAAIIEHLRADNIHINSNQMSYLLKSYKQKEMGNTKFSLNDLVNFAKDNSNIPDDENEVFVANYEYEVEPVREFRIFMTTRNLIKLTQHVSILLIFTHKFYN